MIKLYYLNPLPSLSRSLYLRVMSLFWNQIHFCVREVRRLGTGGKAALPGCHLAKLLLGHLSRGRSALILQKCVDARDVKQSSSETRNNSRNGK
jgi:hypothetical protein